MFFMIAASSAMGSQHVSKTMSIARKPCIVRVDTGKAVNETIITTIEDVDKLGRFLFGKVCCHPTLKVENRWR